MVNDLSLSFPKTDFFAVFSPSEFVERARRLRVYTRLRGPHVRGPMSPDGPGRVPRPPRPRVAVGAAAARGPEPDSPTEPALRRRGRNKPQTPAFLDHLTILTETR